jgi:predicted dehydrogenase
MTAAARETAPGAEVVDGLDALLEMGLDGIVIATPSALHAEQSIRALRRARRCSARSRSGARRTRCGAWWMRRGARPALAVDLSYRFTRGCATSASASTGGELGRVYAVDLTFHNAYGPDKPWFYDPRSPAAGA